MKNIHIIPTDKPSRLFYANKGQELCIATGISTYSTGQNIYITSDEEIKEGDLGTDGTLLGYYGFDGDGCPILKNTKNNTVYEFGLAPHAKKIILTTDIDLIRDGIQAIPDEFLEWFVKNPGCEEVETIYEPKNYLDTKQAWEYLIIIPKEEPKQLFTKGDKVLFTGQMLDENVVDKLVTVFYTMGRGELDDMSDIMDEYTHIYRVWNKDLKHIPKEKPKQETLEEAAEINCERITHPYCDREKAMFIKGAKWQQEQDKNKYSEEELRDMLQSYVEWAINGYGTYYDWFEQFKKK